MKKCPFCSEEIQNSAKKCRHCWEWIEKEIESPESVEKNPEEKILVRESLDKEPIEKWNDLSGIGWWLILPLLGLLYTVFATLKEIKDNFSMRWDILERYVYIFDLSILFNVIIWALAVYSIILFFRKSRNLPKIYIAFLVINLIVTILSAYILESSWLELDETAYNSGQEIGRALIWLIVWWLYMKMSVRVKNTFIN